MTEEIQNTNQTTQPADNSAERNFANLRKKLEATEQEREALRQRATQLEKEREELIRSKSTSHDDDDDDEPYIDKRKLKKELSRHGDEFDKRVERKVQEALEEERRTSYLKENGDFNQVLSEDSLKEFVDANPNLANAILRMPDGFERQKLVYENIKAIKKMKDIVPKSTIQDTINANKRSPFYQGSSGGSPPYGGQVDGQAAYKKMQELKSRMRLG